MLVYTFDEIHSTELGESNSFTKIGRMFFENVSKILLDIRKKWPVPVAAQSKALVLWPLAC